MIGKLGYLFCFQLNNLYDINVVYITRGLQNSILQLHVCTYTQQFDMPESLKILQNYNK